MISEKMLEAINSQINKELFSEYLYLSMAAYFDDIGLKGFANWMRVQMKEERTHAMMMYTYVYEQGGKVTMLPIDQVETEFSSALDAFEKTLEHEKWVTLNIHNIMKLAREENDFASEGFYQWFVTEQVEEEASAKEWCDQLAMAGDKGAGLFMLDREAAARVFALPAQAAGAEVI